MASNFLTSSRLFDQLRAAFGLNQTALGRLLGLSGPMMAQVRSGHRALPLATAVPLARLTLALDQLPADTPAAPALTAAELSALARHEQALRAALLRGVLDWQALRVRAAWAGRRLAALPTLVAHLPAGAPPRWLAHFEAEAREALASSGPLAQARLALRLSSLRHEAAQVARLQAGGYINELFDIKNLDDAGAAPTFTGIINPLSFSEAMAFSVDRLTTRAQCVTYRTRKQTERTVLAARHATILVQIANWDVAGRPEEELAATQLEITTLTPLVAAMAEGPKRRKIENMISDLEKRVNTLETRTENHGPEDLLDREEDRDNLTDDIATLDELLAAVQVRHDALPA